jgi:fructuronate reductase
VRLTSQSLQGCPPHVARPAYDRSAQKVGIVHFGIGAFHRAHQSVYTDDAMNAGARDWGILGVSLRSPTVADQMNPQDGLYSVTAKSGDTRATRIIGAIQKVVVAPNAPEDVIKALASPHTHIVTFTITEKGYCRAPNGGLDPILADDTSVFAYLYLGLAARRVAGLGGLTLLSCDNLAHNGKQLERLLGAYLAARDEGLAAWVTQTCTFPSSMVDRIVPATTSADLDAVQTELGGLFDRAHVTTEPFSQWVIEDKFAGPRPPWEDHGAILVDDVAPYESAKLRMLNGAHSALAYLGLKAGHCFVNEAVGDPDIRPLIDALMRNEAAPTVDKAPGQDLDAYADALLARFDNSALNHRLSQIGMDGSQKIPQRWLETLTWHRARGAECPAIMAALQAWFAHIKGANGPVEDPRADELASIELGQDMWTNVSRIFGGAP